jgi:predicted nucleotidyltransferase component of viral defense system
MSKFFWNTITEKMRDILKGFSRSEIGRHFYLAGGTALALQLGHRRSVDLDFFSATEDIPTTRPGLEETLAGFNSHVSKSASLPNVS